MKKYHAPYFFYIWLIIAALNGCGVGGMKAVTPQNVNEGEDINPFRYGDEFSMKDSGEKTIAEPSNTLKPARNRNSEPLPYSDIHNNSDITEVTKSRNRDLTSDVFGYRVQIGIDEDKERMEKLEKYARRKVDVEVYLEFESPFYRVRVGDFKTKKEAEMYVNKLKSIGFKDSLWVMARINTQ